MFRKARTQVRIVDCFILCISCLIFLLSYAADMLFTAPPAWAAGNTITVHITGTKRPPGFLPFLVTVHIDDTIVFLIDAQPAATYRLAADDQSFVSLPIRPGQQWSVRISSPGTYEYHTLNMTPSLVGAIIVAPSAIKLLSTPDPGVVATEIALSRVVRPQSFGPPAAVGISTTVVLMLAMFTIALVGMTASAVLLLRRKRRA